MSRWGIAAAGLFLALALWQGLGGLLADDEPTLPGTPGNPAPRATPTPSETPTPTEFPTFKGPKPEPEFYDSTEELTADLAEKGIECASLEYLDQQDPTLKEFSLCDPGTPDFRFNIYFYPAAPNRKLWLGDMKAQKLPLPLVWGPNWIIVAAGDPETAKDRIRSIAGAIGGTVEDFSPKKKG